MNLGRSPEPTGISSFASDEELRSNALRRCISFRVERWNSVRQRGAVFATAVRAGNRSREPDGFLFSVVGASQTVASTTRSLSRSQWLRRWTPHPPRSQRGLRSAARQTQRQIRWLTIAWLWSSSRRPLALRSLSLDRGRGIHHPRIRPPPLKTRLLRARSPIWRTTSLPAPLPQPRRAVIRMRRSHRPARPKKTRERAHPQIEADYARAQELSRRLPRPTAPFPTAFRVTTKRSSCLRAGSSRRRRAAAQMVGGTLDA